MREDGRRKEGEEEDMEGGGRIRTVEDTDSAIQEVVHDEMDKAVRLSTLFYPARRVE